MQENKQNITLNVQGMHCVGCSDQNDTQTAGKLSPLEKKFYLCLSFTIPLFIHMFFPHDSFIQNPFVQLMLCLPVMITGILYFGKSAYGSLKTGVPNMDVLIFTGFTAAFIYSAAGMMQHYGTPEMHNYLFFETSAAIITLVLLGNLIEYKSVRQTTTAIKELGKMQEVKAAKVILTADGNENLTQVNYKDICKGDVLLVNTGDKIPVDGNIIWGSCSVDESMISGESIPVDKNPDDKVIGGTLIVKGAIKLKAVMVGQDTVLSKIIEMVKDAQKDKPEIQKIGDKVSAVFVPVVIGISIITFTAAYFIFDLPFRNAVMNSIAVLVISCPCAMGLATPTAVMAGIGRAAKNGILIKGGSTLEQFAKIKNIVFDKTGTLTTGNFRILGIRCFNGSDEKQIRNILYSIEKHSSHPIAKSITKELYNKVNDMELTGIVEEKGTGMTAKDKNGNVYKAGSYSIVKELTHDDTHSVYLTQNNKLIAFIDITDDIKMDAEKTFASLSSQGINTIILSGDSDIKCRELSRQLKSDKVFSEKLPSQKLEIIDMLVREAPTAMVGDGINDAPALEKATVGISISNATQVAIQSAQIIVMNTNDLLIIDRALQISKHTYLTIKQNLFWALFYNVVAIPIAAFGFLSPVVAALTMAFSDVIVIGNSIRLKSKKI